MNLSAIHHIAIIVSDYPRSKDFYVNKLGFSVIRENYRPDKGDWKLDLRINDDTELEIFGVANPPARVTRPEAAGLRHLAFRVESPGNPGRAHPDGCLQWEKVYLFCRSRRTAFGTARIKMARLSFDRRAKIIWYPLPDIDGRSPPGRGWPGCGSRPGGRAEQDQQNTVFFQC